MAKPLVSVLMPAYNAEGWIGEALTSALRQTWDRKEIIVVDDGSTDRTLELARRFESSGVKVVAQKNGGACSARNRALEAAQGEYIQWLDADDLLAPDKISRQLRGLEGERDPLVLLTSAWGRFYFCPKRATFRPDSIWADLQPADFLMRRFEDGVWMNPSAWLVSRRLTDLAGPWDGRLSFSGDDDGEYLCRLVAKSHRIKFTREAIAYYRVGNTGGLSWRKSDKALDAFFLATSLSMQHLLSVEDSTRTRTACIKLLQARLNYFDPVKPSVVRAAHELATELGGTLSPPAATRKFKWVSNVVGWETAMKMKGAVWAGRVSLQKSWDKALHRMHGLAEDGQSTCQG